MAFTETETIRIHEYLGVDRDFSGTFTDIDGRLVAIVANPTAETEMKALLVQIGVVDAQLTSALGRAKVASIDKGGVVLQADEEMRLVRRRGRELIRRLCTRLDLPSYPLSDYFGTSSMMNSGGGNVMRV